MTYGEFLPIEKKYIQGSHKVGNFWKKLGITFLVFYAWKVWELTFVVWNYVRGDKNVKIFKNYKFYHNMTQVIVKLYENVKQRYKKNKKKRYKNSWLEKM